MRYRECYWREEIALYEKQYEATRATAKAKVMELHKHKFNERSFNRKFDAAKADDIARFKASVEKFNKDGYAQVEGIVSQFSPAASKAFDEFSTGFALIAEEFMIAESKADLLYVAKAYNSGKFKAALASLKTNEKNEKIPLNGHTVQHSADNDLLQKEQPTTHSISTTNTATFSEQPIAELGHQQERELSHDHLDDGCGNEHELDHLH